VGEAGEAADQWSEIPIGADTRVQVRAQAHNPSTLLYPFNTICMIEQNNGSAYVSHASGTLIAPQVVLTAGHVIALGAGVLPRVRVSPGLDLSAASAADQSPASPGNQESTSMVRHGTLDLGLIFLPSAFTRPTRYMMLQPRGDQNTATLLTIAGYPRSRPNTTPPEPIRGLMYRHSDQLSVTGITATRLQYSIDTSVGQSGSPLWLLGNDSIRLLLGVHTDAGNFGVRITCAVITWIETECRSRGVTGPVVDRVQQRRVCP
jgi:V8-like Glu-specific endopeptidase